MHFTKQTKNIAYFITITAVILVFIFTHLYKLDQIPKTLYFDEVSIGHNAYLISKTGVDEWGVRYPVLFKAFGEYKNSLYIYTNALVFKLLGFSDFNLRFTSFLFSSLLMASTTLLVRKLFNSKLTTIFVLISVCFLPWFFTLSRIAFEVISQPALYSLFILLLYMAMHTKLTDKKQLIYIFIAGLVLGLNFYAYSTSRLLVPLILVATLAIYFDRKRILRTITFIFGVILTSIPFVFSYINNQKASTLRFEMISQWFDKNLTLLEKLSITVNNYISYLTPKFLLTTGDLNLRHTTGYSGQIYNIIAILSLVGFVILIKLIKTTKNKFFVFLLCSSFLILIPASLTIDPMHALRSVIMGYYIIIFASFGFNFVISKSNSGLWGIFLILVLCLETILYLNNYFSLYAAKTKLWFGGPNIEYAINKCIKSNSKTIVIKHQNLEPIYINYYSHKSNKIKFETSTTTSVECLNN